MPSEDQKISLLLDGTIDDRSAPEHVSPIVQHQSSPPLLESTNTRLSPVRGTCTRSPAFTALRSVLPDNPCFGIVPAGAGNSAAVFYLDDTQQVSMPDLGAYTSGLLRAAKSNTNPQTCYRPAQITYSGAIPANAAYSRISSAVTANAVWYAYVAPTSTTGTTGDIYAYLTNGQGTALSQPTFVTTVTIEAARPSGLTVTNHSNAVTLWWYEETTTSLMRCVLTLVGNRIVVGTPTVQQAGGGGPNQWAVTAYAGGLAVIVVRTGGGSTVQVVDAATGAVSASAAVTIAGAYAVSCATIAGVRYIAVGIADTSDARAFLFTFNGSALTQVWTSSQALISPASATRVAVQFLRSTQLTGAQVAVVVAVSDVAGSFWQGAMMGTTFCYFSFASGTSLGIHELPWRVLADLGATVRYDSTGDELRPVFGLARVYGTVATGGDPDGVDYIDDPSIEMYVAQGSTVPPAPVARYGTVRGQISPARVLSDEAITSAGVSSDGRTVFTAYRKDNYQQGAGNVFGYYGRYVAVNFDPVQPAVAQDKDGAAMVAAALPVQWDGVEIVETGGPLHAPRLAGRIDTGILPVAAGVYSFKALYQWTDASGLTHRSRPSNTITLTSTGIPADKPVLRVSIPDSLRNGTQTGAVSILIYGTPVNGSSYHLMRDLPTAQDVYQVTYEVVTPPVGTTGQQLYSVTGAGGEELFPQPPPPLWDIAVIGSRAWGIDAEYRTRLVYTKLRISGIGFEWAPALEVPFPGGSGKLMAVREYQGTVLVFTERAVYQVSGAGPSNTGQGDTYGPPSRLADLGCTSRASVLVTPAGIVWQYNDWFVLLGAQGAALVPNIRCSGVISGAVLMRNQDEAVFFTADSATKYVYNYARDRWTKWDSGTYFYPVNNVIAVPTNTQRTLAYSQTGGALTRIDHDTVSEVTSMRWATDWIQLGGDWQDSVLLRWLVVKGKSLSTHNLTAEIYVNFNDAAAVPSMTWLNADLVQLRDAAGRFDVKLEPTEQNTRAVRIVLYDTLTGTPGGGFQPSAVTLLWALDDGLIREETFAVSEQSIR